MSDRDKLIRNKLLSFLITFSGLMLFAFNKSNHGNGSLLFVGIIIAIVGIVYFYMTYKCPYCGTVLNSRGPTPHYCPHCGEEFI